MHAPYLGPHTANVATMGPTTGASRGHHYRPPARWPTVGPHHGPRPPPHGPHHGPPWLNGQSTRLRTGGVRVRILLEVRTGCLPLWNGRPPGGHGAPWPPFVVR